MRYGDIVVVLSLILNLMSAAAYAWQLQWWMVMYFIGAGLINGSLVCMWYFK